MKDPAMWQRCLEWPLPDGPEGEDFTDWCASHQDITRSQAAEVVMEYRRFAYLAASGAAARPVAPGRIGPVLALHRTTPDFDRFRREGLAGARLDPIGRPRRADHAAMGAAYAAEFGKPPPIWSWKTRSRLWLWALAGGLGLAGAVASWFDGSLAPLALGGIPALLILLYIRIADRRMAGSDGMTDAARYGGGMGGAG